MARYATYLTGNSDTKAALITMYAISTATIKSSEVTLSRGLVLPINLIGKTKTDKTEIINISK